MRILFSLLFFPVILLAQDVNEFWTTPIANVEFTGEKIIYTYAGRQGSLSEQVIPEYYDIRVLEIRDVKIYFWYGYKAQKSMIEQIKEYLNDWEMGVANNRDKHYLLEVMVIYVIWNIAGRHSLPTKTLEILSWLESDLSIEVSRNAKLVRKLYESYQ